MAVAAALGAVMRVLLIAGLLALSPAGHAAHYTVVIAGLGGDAGYAERFATQAQSIVEAAERGAEDASQVILLSGAEARRESIRGRLQALAAEVEAGDSIAVYLVGHGSYDGDVYKFNLPGPDLDAAEFAALFDAIPARAQLVVNASSASGAVLEPWAADGRILVTATRTGAERNATRFAEYWALALFADEADVNKNGVVTAAEAFEYASRRVADSFTDDGTLATEHPQLVGDGAARFEVARLAARVQATPRQERLLSERDRLEQDIAALREQRDTLSNDAYLDQLQALLLQLALVQRELDGLVEAPPAPSP
jgi:hypothetical protein